MVDFSLSTEDADQMLECPSCEDLIPIEERCFELESGLESLKFTCPYCNFEKICPIEDAEGETMH